LKLFAAFMAAWLLFATASSARAQTSHPLPRVVELKSSDGTVLKASYFAAAKPGPAVLLFHQSNRTRKSWEDVARQLAAVGINVLTIDTGPNKTRTQRWPGDLDAAFEFLVSQPEVKRDIIGSGGTGVIGVEDSVKTARLHSVQGKSLVLLSGETESLDFLRQASQLPELFVVADDDEYAPIVEAMELLYVTASSPSRKFVHYSASHGMNPRYRTALKILSQLRRELCPRKQKNIAPWVRRRQTS
jgi:hypothetical protein